MSRQIEYKISRFIQKYDLIQKGDELILGVSGGADSMMLFHYLYTHQAEYGIKLKIAHVQHGVRVEAEEDARLVEAVSRSWQVPFYRHDCNIKELAKTRQMSEEEAGREERYNFFISLLNENGKIVTAHNMNDQAETLIMRFFRGTDIKGLGGILPKRNQIIRPLLCLTRDEIEKYCQINKVAYRDDHTNFMPIYTRNKIRLEGIPYIKEHINPSVIRVLGEHSHLYQEEEDFLKAHTEQLFDRCAVKEKDKLIIELELFEGYHDYMQKRILLLGIQEMVEGVKNITSRHIDSAIDLAKGQSGKKVCMPYGLVIKKEYHKLIMEKEAAKKQGYCYPLELGTHLIPEAEMKVVLTLVEAERIQQKDENIYTKYIDYGRIKNGLQIRTRLPYDYIKTGQGTKKLKKVFTDDKISQTERESIPLIADGDEIVWIVGSRLNTDYYITQETKQILRIQMTYDD